MFAVGDEVRMRGASFQRGIVHEVLPAAKIVIQYFPMAGELFGGLYVDYATHWEFDPEYFLVFT